MDNSIIRTLQWIPESLNVEMFHQWLFLHLDRALETASKGSDYLNTCDPNIHFTYVISQELVHFLDITVLIQGQKLITDLYCKPTDSCNYLHICPDVRTVYHTASSCSQCQDFDKYRKEMAVLFHRQGVPYWPPGTELFDSQRNTPVFVMVYILCGKTYQARNKRAVIWVMIHVACLYVEFDVGYMVCKQNKSDGTAPALCPFTYMYVFAIYTRFLL